MNLIKYAVLLYSFLIAISSCSSSTNNFTDTSIIIKKGETIKVKGLGLKITNNGCGREWVSGSDGDAYEKPVCGLKYVMDDSVKYAGDSFKPVYFGNIEIEIDQMNVWNKEEDSIPPGGCRLKIRKLEQSSSTGK